MSGTASPKSASSRRGRQGPGGGQNNEQPTAAATGLTFGDHGGLQTGGAGGPTAPGVLQEVSSNQQGAATGEQHDTQPGGLGEKPDIQTAGDHRDAQKMRDILAQRGGPAGDMRAAFEDVQSEVAADVGLVFKGGRFAEALARDIPTKPYTGNFVKEGEMAKDVVGDVMRRFWSQELAGVTLEQRCATMPGARSMAELTFYVWCYLHGSNEAESGTGSAGAAHTGGRVPLAGVEVTGAGLASDVFGQTFSIHRFVRAKCEDIHDAIVHVITQNARGVKGYEKLETLIRARANLVRLSDVPQYAFVGGEFVPGITDAVQRRVQKCMRRYVRQVAAQSTQFQDMGDEDEA